MRFIHVQTAYSQFDDEPAREKPKSFYFCCFETRIFSLNAMAKWKTILLKVKHKKCWIHRLQIKTLERSFALQMNWSSVNPRKIIKHEQNFYLIFFWPNSLSFVRSFPFRFLLFHHMKQWLWLCPFLFIFIICFAYVHKFNWLILVSVSMRYVLQMYCKITMIETQTQHTFK